jgi:hypothetical protein
MINQQSDLRDMGDGCLCPCPISKYVMFVIPRCRARYASILITPAHQNNVTGLGQRLIGIPIHRVIGVERADLRRVADDDRTGADMGDVRVGCRLTSPGSSARNASAMRRRSGGCFPSAARKSWVESRPPHRNSPDRHSFNGSCSTLVQPGVLPGARGHLIS